MNDIDLDKAIRDACERYNTPITSDTVLNIDFFLKLADNAYTAGRIDMMTRFKNFFDACDAKKSNCTVSIKTMTYLLTELIQTYDKTN